MEIKKDRVRQKAVNFQSTTGLSEYSGLEYWDNPVVRPEVAFYLTFRLGNNRDYTNSDWDKITFVPAS
ncbi:MAG: hypothetical protein LKF37_03970 [Lentilactobacillus diolivorans]|nr:hypothetical protein [Lentilactobacillus diolivorans]